VKQHNKEVNAAFQAYYGVNSYRSNTQAAVASKAPATVQQ
jgi:hypothetical protein